MTVALSRLAACAALQVQFATDLQSFEQAPCWFDMNLQCPPAHLPTAHLPAKQVPELELKHKPHVGCLVDLI